MKGINNLQGALRERLGSIQKKVTRLFDYDTEKFERAPSDDWYRLLWITMLLSLLFTLLHAYVWIMVRGIAEDEGERVVVPRLVSGEELLQAVSVQAQRERKYGEVLGTARAD